MRITVSSARTALAQDMQTMREKETAIEQAINALNTGIDENLLMSASYLATADLISRILLPTGYSIHRVLRERLEMGQTYEAALGTLGGMDVWDRDEINRHYEESAQSYQYLLSQMEACCTPETKAALLESCDIAEKTMRYWEDKKNRFDAFIGATNATFSGLAQGLLLACQNTRFEYNAVSGEWSIDGLSVDTYREFNSMTISKDKIVDEFERINPELAKKVWALYYKTTTAPSTSSTFIGKYEDLKNYLGSGTPTESDVFSEWTWVKFRYCLYTSPAKVRNLYIANNTNLHDIYSEELGPGYGSVAGFQKDTKSIKIDELAFELQDVDPEVSEVDYIDMLFHELGHAANTLASDWWHDQTSENYFLKKAYVKDVEKRFYNVAWGTITKHLDDSFYRANAHQVRERVQEYTRTVLDARKSEENRKKAEALLQLDPYFEEAVQAYRDIYTDNSGISDISGAATGNILCSGIGHTVEYWQQRRFEDPSKPNDEGFANYLAAIAQGDFKSVQQFQRDFPHSAELYEKAIQNANMKLNPLTANHSD